MANFFLLGNFVIPVMSVNSLPQVSQLASKEKKTVKRPAAAGQVMLA